MNMKNKKNNLKFKILLIISFICIAIIITPKVFQNDTFYTIKVGESIIENGVDMKEHFAWTEGLEYTYPHWLYDVFIYLIYNFFGLNGIYISTIILSFILISTMYFTCNKITKDRGISYILSVILSLTMSSFIAARAQLVTYILFLIILYSIEMFRDTKNKRYSLYIILCSLLIANLHCAVWPFIFVLFLPYLVSDIIFFVNSKYFDNWVSLDRVDIENGSNFKSTLIVMIISIFTGFLTPNRFVPFTYLIKTKMGVSMSHISEHLPITINERPQLFVILSILIIFMLKKNMKIKLKDLFLLGGLALLAFMSRRSYALFAVLAIFSIARLLVMYIGKSSPLTVEKVLLNNIIFVIFICLFLSTSFAILSSNNKKDFINSKKYPVELSDYIINNLDLDNIKLFNEYNFGSYLLYKNIPVFIDSRADLYLEEFNPSCTIFRDAVGLYKSYNVIFDKYDISHVVIYNTNKLKVVLDLDDGYKELYEDDYFSLYERV